MSTNSQIQQPSLSARRSGTESSSASPVVDLCSGSKTLQVTGPTEGGTVWGSGPYTTDSDFKMHQHSSTCTTCTNTLGNVRRRMALFITGFTQEAPQERMLLACWDAAQLVLVSTWFNLPSAARLSRTNLVPCQKQESRRCPPPGLLAMGSSTGASIVLQNCCTQHTETPL